jgi:putative NADH-flavin reductase
MVLLYRRDIALAYFEQYKVCKAGQNVDWTYFCSATKLVSGERTGSHRKGNDKLIVDASVKAVISVEGASGSSVG